MQPQNRDALQILEPFRRRWWLIALIAVAVGAGTYYYYHHKRPDYVATTTLFVRSAGTSQVVGTDPETDPSRLLQNEATLLQTPAVARQVAKRLHYTGDPRDLLTQITVTPSSNSDFVTITATTSDPANSAAVANSFARAFAKLNATQTKSLLDAQQASVNEQLARLPRTLANQPLRANLETELQTLELAEATPPPVQQVDAAIVPSIESTASPTRNAIFGAILGVVLGCILVKALEAFDRRLRSPVVEAEYGLPLLASIPFSRKAHAGTRSGAQVPIPIMEGTRGLRTMLDHGTGRADSPRTVLLTSAVSGEGKSTLTKSLALSYYESARSVLVIDADLRRPMIHELFGALLVPGLTDVLRSAIPLSEAVQQVEPGNLVPAFDRELMPGEQEMALVAHEPTAPAPNGMGTGPRGRSRRGAPMLRVLTSGSATSDPAALLGSGKLAALLAEATATYDVVLIDSTPILTVSDVIPVATSVDAVVVVARSDFTTRDAAQRCRHALERVRGVNVVGVVANGVRDETEATRRYYVGAAG
jgi:tyrosine-protein kinase